MNEDRIESLLGDYAEGLKASPGAPKRVIAMHGRAHRKALAIWSGAGALAAGALCVGLLVLPSASAARTFSRIKHAIKGVSSMHLQGFAQNSRDKFVEIWSVDGMWRSDHGSRAYTKGSRIVRDGREFDYDARTGLTTWVPAGAPGYGQPYSSETAVNYALSWAQHAPDPDHENITRIEQRQLVDGPGTYRITYDEKYPKGTCIIVVDAATNLPVRQTMVEGDPDLYHRTFTFLYEFNKPTPPHEFDPPTKPIDLLAEEDKWLRAWASPLTSFGDTQIRDVAITPQGEVYMAFTNSGRSRLDLEPVALNDGLGTEYVRVSDVGAGGNSGDCVARTHFAFPNRDLSVARFAPLVKPRATPTTVRIGFAKAKYVPSLPWEVGYDQPVGWSESSCRPLPTDLPDYSMAMDFGYTTSWFEEEMDRARSQYLKERNRIEEAEKWQVKLYEDESKRDPYSAHRELRPAIEMLMQLGKKDEARKMQQKELLLAAHDTIPAERARALAP